MNYEEIKRRVSAWGIQSEFSTSEKAAIEEIAETKEKVELELQKSPTLLDNSNEIKIGINPSY